MRTLWLGLMVVLVAALSQGAFAQGSYEPGVDRQGSDYHNFDIQGGPAACQSVCVNDRRCVAWTFVHQSVQGAAQRCWLKSGVPAPHGDSCCVSGVARSPAAAGRDQGYNPGFAGRSR